MDIKLDIGEIQLGMFVSELDRPWTDSSFLFQGFLIESEDQIRELKAQCSYVIVSQENSLPGIFETASPVPKKSALPTEPAASYVAVDNSKEKVPAEKKTGVFSTIKQIGKEILTYRSKAQPPETAAEFPSGISNEDDNIAELRRRQDIKKIRQSYANHGDITTEIVHYPIQVAIEQEFTTAKETTARFEQEIASSLMLEMTGESLSDRIDVAKDLLADVVNSIIRNPDAMLLIRQLKDLDDITYHHAMDVSIILVTFGRQLGLPKKELNEIALGGLLHDIGKSRVPSEIINKKQRLNAEETIAARNHVNLGIEVIAGLESLSDIARQVIERHHERYDGKGYPTGLAAEDIGLYGSMAGIVETFSSITSHQPYSAARSSAQAVSILVALRDLAFQGELVDQFIQVVGVYPIGSLVKLNTGEVGIVIKQNSLWRLKPMVSIVIDTDGRKLPSPMTIDLVRPPQLDAKPIAIAAELPAGSYGINARDYFL